jgi:hypothetical protein
MLPLPSVADFIEACSVSSSPDHATNGRRLTLALSLFSDLSLGSCSSQVAAVFLDPLKDGPGKFGDVMSQNVSRDVQETLHVILSLIRTVIHKVCRKRWCLADRSHVALICNGMIFPVSPVSCPIAALRTSATSSARVFCESVTVRCGDGRRVPQNDCPYVPFNVPVILVRRFDMLGMQPSLKISG